MVVNYKVCLLLWFREVRSGSPVTKLLLKMGPGSSGVKNLPVNAGDAGPDPWVRKIPWRRKWQPTPVFLPGNPMDRKTWRAIVHGITKESDTT